MAKFFYIPFATAGDVTAVPNAEQPNGSISYDKGYGPDYQLPLAGGGQALAIDRPQFNQLMNDITLSIQNMQEQGIFSWIGNVAELGGNFPYPLNALVYYNNIVWQSKTTNNIDTPGVTTSWYNISINAGGLPIGSSIDFMGVLPPVNYLVQDGSAILRATYPALLSAITLTLSGVTIGGNPVVTMANTIGVQIGFKVEASNIVNGTTVIAITPNVSITLSNNPSTSITTPFQFFPWSNGNGSTTFTLPNLQGNVALGSGGSLTILDRNTVGGIGGTASNTISIANMPAHNHPGSTVPVTNQNLNSGFANVDTVNGSSTGQLSIASQGGGTAMNNVQPSVVVLKCIKYQ